MERKRILAFVLALGMVFGSTMTAFADEYTAKDETTGTTVEGEGDVKYVDTTRYSVTLPTTSATAAGVLVDPQGLTKMQGETATLAELKESGFAGKIYGQEKLMVINAGSVPTKVSVKLTVAADAAHVKTVADEVSVSASDPKAPNFMIYAVPSKEDVKGNTDNYVASTTGIVLTTTDSTVDFVLPAAEYVVKKETVSGNDTFSYVRKEDGDVHGTAFSIEGIANPDGDWSKYVGAGPEKTIHVQAVFTFTSTIADGDTVSDGNPYGMVSPASTVTLVDVTPTEAGPSAPATATYNGTTGGTFTVNFGVGDLAATKIVKIQWSNDGTTFKDFGKPSDSYSIDGNTVTIKKAYNSSASAGTVSYFKVVFDKGDAATVELTKE